jgi:heme-degrading monooxygenase HmoA
MVWEAALFCVIFEVHPRSGQWDAYLGTARMLRPELERIDGFVDNVRYRSLTREGWILSLSSWRDEKALIRWRTRAPHHAAQERGRNEIFSDYHLRVGQVTSDTYVPEGHGVTEQRLDETQAGAGTTVTLITMSRPLEEADMSSLPDCAGWLGLDPWSEGSTSWDIFEAVLTPGDLVLLVSWRDAAAAQAYEDMHPIKKGFRARRIRIIRDYGMFDRREAPQYYPDAPGGGTIHS